MAINAAGMTPERMEIELFGDERRTARRPRKVGVFEEAHGGTLFLDEVADMPRETQGRILRVLVDQTFQRVGGNTKVRSTCASSPRPAATSRPRSQPGRFREDLYHRLNVVPVRVPALAERREDIPELVDYFMEQISQSTGLPQAHASARTPWRCCRRTTGRATCASCATTSSG